MELLRHGLRMINPDLLLGLVISMEQHEQRTQDFRPPEDPGKGFSRSYLLRLSGSLGLDPITVILQAEAVRERGLSLIRAGQFENADYVLKEAERICSQANLPNHASAAARTFQSAAEAYLAYRLGQYELAIQLLRESLSASAVLSNDFGHDMEFRKVHLGRNIIRAQCFITPTDHVIHSTLELIAYISGNFGSWPFADGPRWTTKRALNHAELFWSIDETITNLTLPVVNLARSEFSEAIVGKIDAASKRNQPAANAAYEWMLALIYGAMGKDLEMLNHATAYFATDPGGLIHARRGMIQMLRAKQILDPL